MRSGFPNVETASEEFHERDKDARETKDNSPANEHGAPRTGDSSTNEDLMAFHAFPCKSAGGCLIPANVTRPRSSFSQRRMWAA